MSSSFHLDIPQDKKEYIRLFFAICLSLFIGMMGGMAERPLYGIGAAILLASLLGGLKNVVTRTIGIYSGVASGAILGVLVAIVILALPGQIDDISSGLQFGAWRGALIGGAFGYLTRAHPDEDDSLAVHLFLIVGSIGIGAVLGMIVGTFTGFMLGWLFITPARLFIGLLTGLIVGGFVFSRGSSPGKSLIGSLLIGFITMMAQLIGGAVSGVFLGAVCGTLVPIIVMVLIGIYGGLHRGGAAVFREAVQTPREMIEQGAVPMLAPALLVGLMIGTAVAGIRAILVIPTVLALGGLFLGAFGEIEGRPINRVSPKAIVKLLILGADRWPLSRLGKRIKENQRQVIKGAFIGVNLGILGSLIGIWLGQSLPVWLNIVIRSN